MKFRTFVFAPILFLAIAGFDILTYTSIKQGFYNKLIGPYSNNIILIEGNKIKHYGLGDAQIIMSQGIYKIKNDTLLIEVIEWWKFSGNSIEPNTLPKIDTIILTLKSEREVQTLKNYNYRGCDEDLKAYIKKRIRGIRTTTYHP
jgi:hypothetical protein